ncbi:MAG: hypothetical protein L6Q99_04895 [Planctomycetes bacterium]|nr:hypothetical protein [Planctomycetota bacterium]
MLKPSTLRVFAGLLAGLFVAISTCSLTSLASASAQKPQAKKKSSPNTELYALYREDLTDRYDTSTKDSRDRAEKRRTRAERLDAILKKGELGAAVDFYYAGRMLAREGEPIERIALGHALLSAAACQKVEYSLGATVEALDRWMLAADQPQQLCSILDGESSNASPTPPFEDRVHQSIRAEFELEPLHYDDRKPESKGKKPKGFNSKEARRLATAVAAQGTAGGPLDATLKRMRDIVSEGGLTGAEDWLAAARVLSKSTDSGDLAIAHALALLATSKGEASARELVPATLDGLLRGLGSHEAFGSALTIGSNEHAFDAWGLELDAALRTAFGLPIPDRAIEASGDE